MKTREFKKKTKAVTRNDSVKGYQNPVENTAY